MHRPDVSTLARAAAVGIEDMIRHKTTETGVLIGADGKTILKRHGKADRVRFTHGELLAAAGMTFTHNHPGGHAHSFEDLRLCAFYEMHELRVVTADNRHGVSMLKRRHIGPMKRLYGGIHSGASIATSDDVRRGLIHPRDFGVEVQHRTLQRLSAQIGFDYWRQAS